MKQTVTNEEIAKVVGDLRYSLSLKGYPIGDVRDRVLEFLFEFWLEKR